MLAIRPQIRPSDRAGDSNAEREEFSHCHRLDFIHRLWSDYGLLKNTHSESIMYKVYVESEVLV